MKLLLEVDGGAIAAAETAMPDLIFLYAGELCGKALIKALQNTYRLVGFAEAGDSVFALGHLVRKFILKQGNTGRGGRRPGRRPAFRVDFALAQTAVQKLADLFHELPLTAGEI